MLCVQWCVCLIDVENELTNGNIISYYVLKYTSDYNIKPKLRGFSIYLQVSQQSASHLQSLQRTHSLEHRNVSECHTMLI